MPTEGNWNVGLGAAPETTFLLDAIGASATAAYSTRRLKSSWVASCLRVRRNTDNTEQDIGFVDNLLDTSSMLSFVGGGNNGYVVTWYDQTANGRSITQSTAGNQPQIVSAGVLEVINSKPALKFIPANLTELTSALAVTNFMTVSAYTALVGIHITTFSGSSDPEHSGAFVVSSGANWTPIAANSIGGSSLTANHNSGVDETASLTATATDFVVLTRFGSGALSIYKNGGTPNTDASAANAIVGVQTLEVGGRTASGTPACFGGLATEILLFDTTLSNADVNTLGGGAGIIKGSMSSYNGTSWTSI